jgi:eukaryotic-like serine/threonine-protein kinase
MWVLPEPGGSGPAKPFPILATPFAEGQGRFSPDGRWIAYVSTESGSTEVYVRPFSPDAGASASGPKWLISKGSGLLPRWRADGKQLLYVTQNGFDVMAVDIDTRHGFQAGAPRRLFTLASVAGGWDIAPDAKRFLFVASPSGGRTAPFTVVLNWQAGLKK